MKIDAGGFYKPDILATGRQSKTSDQPNITNQITPDFKIYDGTATSVPLYESDTQYDFARRGYIAHARNAGLSQAEQIEFADDMLAGKDRETLRLVNDDGEMVSDQKFAVDKKAGSKEFFLTEKQLSRLQSRQKESFAKREPNPGEQAQIKIGINQASLKRAEIERKYEAQQSAIPVDVMSARDSSAERTVTAAADLIESATGTNPNTIGAVLNRQAVSAIKVLGDAAEMVGADETAQALKSASTEVTRADERTAELLKKNGIEPNWEAGVQSEMQRTPEFLKDIGEGIIIGDFSEKDTYGVKIGQIVGGINPAADIRDIIANGGKVYKGEDGAWIVLGASIVGAIPIIGDGGKIILKAEKEAIAEATEKFVKQGVEKETAEKLAKEEGC